MRLLNNDFLLFIGDSITDCGRGEANDGNSNLGNGYVNMVNDLLGAQYSDRRIKIVNLGISGNRVIDLEERWDKDVIQRKPDWLSVMIGVNDVWRHFDTPFLQPQVSLEKFQSVYELLIKIIRPQLKGLILQTAFYLEKNKNDPFRVLVDTYNEVVKELAQKYDCLLVDTQAAFDRFMEDQDSRYFCGDRVHPNGIGHMIIAKTFLKALEYRWD